MPAVDTPNPSIQASIAQAGFASLTTKLWLGAAIQFHLAAAIGLS